MNNGAGNRAQGHLTLSFRCQSPEARSARRRRIAGCAQRLFYGPLPLVAMRCRRKNLTHAQHVLTRKRLATMVPCLFAIVVAAGCASTKVTSRQQLVSERLPRPDHILVYYFGATPADVPADSGFAGQIAEPSTPQTAEQIEAGRQLGAQLAIELAANIRAMGLPAEAVTSRTSPRVGDIVIRGYLFSIEEGSAAKRVAIGFGAGGSELKTAVEGYQMTAQGLRKLGSGTVESGGGKSPGAALGVVGLAATANPAGLIISSGVKAYGEVSGSSKIEGRAKQTAKEIADVLKKRFQEQGWIN